MKEAIARCIRLTFSPKHDMIRSHCARRGKEPGHWRLQQGRIRGGRCTMMMHPEGQGVCSEAGLQQLAQRAHVLPGTPREALLSRCPLSVRCELGGDVPALHGREQPRQPPTSPLPWQCQAAFPGLLGEMERGQGFLVQCHGPMVGISAWHRRLAATLACPEVPATAPSGSWGCPMCTAPAVPGMLLWGLSPALASQGTPMAPVTHWALHARARPCRQFGNGHAGNTGQAAHVTGPGEWPAMSKHGFSPWLSSSGWLWVSGLA